MDDGDGVKIVENVRGEGIVLIRRCSYATRQYR